jgi:hypothetical protein
MSITPEELDAIGQIAHDRSGRGAGRSMRDLLQTTRYSSLRPHITVPDLVSYFRSHQMRVEEWVSYSEDKRTSGGWCLLPGSEVWRVWAVDSALGPARQFDDAAEACAEYVLQELDFWNGIGGQPGKRL